MAGGIAYVSVTGWQKIRKAPSRKTPTNLSLRRDLVEHAKALKINLSEVLEVALVAEIRDKERAAWLAENHEAIDEYNERVERDGVFGKDWRTSRRGWW